MAKRQFIKIQKILAELFGERGLSLNKIVVFGSWARGRQTKESDIDLIIVSRDFRGKDLVQRVELVNGIHAELVHRTKKPFDILYYSDQEWKEGRGLIINEAKKNGKVIFG